MYTPAAFEEADPARIHEIVRRYPFSTLLTTDGRSVLGSHLPLLLRADPHGKPHGQLAGHLARANRQWEQFAEGREVLAIFHGPHAYVSPSWYQDPQNVPTWNYVAVHAYGIARVHDDPARLLALVQQMVAVFEAPLPRPWRLDAADEFVAKLLQAIVGFEIEVTRWEAKLKLSQNRSPQDRAGALRGLAEQSDPMSWEVAEWMRAIGM